jgi:hypothetical protein
MEGHQCFSSMVTMTTSTPFHRWWRHHQPQLDRQSRRPGARRERVSPVRAAYAALAWVVAFFAFHIYWYAGGSFGSPGKLPSLLPDHLIGWILEPLGLAWPLGAWVCLAIARGWPRGRMGRTASVLVWLGCTVLVVRGGAGLVDDLTRAVGLLPKGITGLTHKQTMGAAYYRSASVVWANNAIDGYFFFGGLIFGLLGYRYRPARSEARHGVPRALVNRAGPPRAPRRRASPE